MSQLKSNVLDEDEVEEPEYIQYKVVIVGDAAVGKTSICQRFCSEHYLKEYKVTIGLDFFVKRIELPGQVHVLLQIWDIGGQTIGSKMIQTYLFGANAILMTYDISSSESFQNLEKWLDIVKKTFQEQQLPYMAIIGNKSDLFHLQATKLEVHNKFAEDHTLYSYFVSAKSGDQINSTFYRIAADLAGVVLTKPEVEVAQKVIKAQIINQKAENEAQVSLPQASKKKKRKCIIF